VFSKKELQELIPSSVDDPSFFEDVFRAVSLELKKKRRKNPDNLLRILQEALPLLSEKLDQTGCMDSFALRNIVKARRLANLLIDSSGAIQFPLLERAIGLLKEHLYPIGPRYHQDCVRNKHILHCLQELEKNKEIQKALMAITKPHMHSVSDEIIRATLHLKTSDPISDAQTRRAALSAWFVYLRQVLGSCFATAPAIIAHDELPLMFFQDISSLLSSGRLVRTFNGVEHTAPLCKDLESIGGILILSFPEGVEEKLVFLASLPPLYFAFEEEIFPEGCSDEEKETLLKKLGKQLFEKVEEPLAITIETLIEQLLMVYFELSPRQLEEWQGLPKSFAYGSLVVQAPSSCMAREEKKITQNRFSLVKKRLIQRYRFYGENTLLRTWEYTIASFAEAKSEFSQWNLFASLGLNAQDEGGIGQSIYKWLSQKIDECNKEVEGLQRESEMLYQSVQVLENRLRRPFSEEEVKWTKVEYQSKSLELSNLQRLRDKYYEKARKFASLFDLLIETYMQFMPQYFQEVYDPSMVDVSQSSYDDTPAGFRLMYKHGRANSSQWTGIHGPQEFIDHLASFFSAVEREISFNPEFQDISDDIGRLTSEVIAHIRTDEFMRTAFARMAVFHKQKLYEKPLEHLEEIEKKPWAYTSGGSLSHLANVYFASSEQEKESARWVENPMELLVFAVDTIKKLPRTTLDVLVSSKRRSLLMHSPTHAFLLKPSLPPFAESWKHDAFTYTWVRDHLVSPQEVFASKQIFNSESLQYIVQCVARRLQKPYGSILADKLSSLKGTFTPGDLRGYIEDLLERERFFSKDIVKFTVLSVLDSTLYAHLPLIPSYKLFDHMRDVLDFFVDFPKEKKEQMLELLDQFIPSVRKRAYFGSVDFQNSFLALLLLVDLKDSFPQDHWETLRYAMRTLGLCYPEPIFFADTNWPKDLFAFIVSPTTQKLELWRSEPYGVSATPLLAWKPWLDGTVRSPMWGILENLPKSLEKRSLLF